MAEVFNFNGSQNENNCFKPLDMNSNDIRSNTGNLTLSTTASVGTGNIILAPNAAASVLIQSETDPTNDFISINPQTSGNSQRLQMTATDAPSGFKNSIDLLNSQFNPFLELKGEFGVVSRSISLHADGVGSKNVLTAFDTQANNPFQIDTSGYTGGSIDLKVNDTSGDLILTGTGLESNTSTGPTGKYLRIKLNGTYYKIVLEND
jgi:hypothetical protein